MRWIAVCRYDDLLPERAVAALLGDEQVVVVRTHDGTLYVVGNRDPDTGACVLSRGIVGSRGDRPTLIAPLHKQAYDLGTGACLDDPALRVQTYGVRVDDGVVHVATRPGARSAPTADATGPGVPQAAGTASK